MKRILSIFIFLLLCSQAYAMNVVMMSGEGTSTAGASSETLGQETAGGTANGAADNNMYCYKLGETPSSNGSIKSITVTARSAGGTGNAHVRLSIYNHDASNDIPSTVVTNSATAEIDVTSQTDYTFNYDTKPSVTSGTQYWLCYSGLYDADSPQYLYTDGAGGRIAGKAITYGQFPDWAGTAGGTTADRYFGKFNIVNEW